MDLNLKQQAYRCFISAQKQFAPALKSSINPHFRSKYADLSACIEAVIDALNSNDLALVQRMHDFDQGVAIETVFIHSSGEEITNGILRIPATKKDAQGYGSALTYARRYSLMSACGIAPEDDDGNGAIKHSPRPSCHQHKKKVDTAKLIAQGGIEAKKGENALMNWFGSLSRDEKLSISSEDKKNLKSLCPLPELSTEEFLNQNSVGDGD